MGTLPVGGEQGVHQCSQRQQGAAGDARGRVVGGAGARGGSQVGGGARYRPVLPGGEPDDDMVSQPGGGQRDQGEGPASERVGRVDNRDVTTHLMCE